MGLFFAERSRVYGAGGASPPGQLVLVQVPLPGLRSRCPTLGALVEFCGCFVTWQQGRAGEAALCLGLCARNQQLCLACAGSGGPGDG